jgi:hypothetical protein
LRTARSRPRLRRAAGAATATLLACAAVLLSTRVAHAQGYYDHYEERERAAFALGFDLEGAVPINLPQVNGNDVSGGGGFKVRVGEQLHFPGIRFTPEIGYGYTHLFASDDAGNAYAWDLHRAFGGARLAFGHFLVPVIYGHVGYGWRATGDPSVPSAGGVTYDLGGALDLHVIPHFGIGAHIEYGEIDSQPYTPQWVAFGLHADIVF